MLVISLVCAFPSGYIQPKKTTNPDLNQDGSVNIRDAYILLGFLGQNGKSFSIKNPDLNGDNIVSLPDLAEVISSFGVCDNHLCNTDLNKDGVVNHQDVYIIRGFYNHDPEGIISPDLNTDEKIDIADLSVLLSLI